MAGTKSAEFIAEVARVGARQNMCRATLALWYEARAAAGKQHRHALAHFERHDDRLIMRRLAGRPSTTSHATTPGPRPQLCERCTNSYPCPRSK